jgi:hypothetical protein
MAEIHLTSVKLNMKYEKGSFTYASLKPTATDAGIYELAQAISSLQTVQPAAINKIVTSRVVQASA